MLGVIAGIATQRATRDDERGRIAGIEDRNAQFAASVQALVAALPGHADLVGRAPEVAVATLVDRREQAQAVAVMHATLTEERARHGEELETARRTARMAEARIGAILADSGMTDEAALDAAIARSLAHADACERIAAIEARLRDPTARPSTGWPRNRRTWATRRSRPSSRPSAVSWGRSAHAGRTRARGSVR